MFVQTLNVYHSSFANIRTCSHSPKYALKASMWKDEATCRVVSFICATMLNRIDINILLHAHKVHGTCFVREEFSNRNRSISFTNDFSHLSRSFLWQLLKHITYCQIW